MTIPRLELVAAALSVQEDDMMRRELSLAMEVSFFWIDDDPEVKREVTACATNARDTERDVTYDNKFIHYTSNQCSNNSSSSGSGSNDNTTRITSASGHYVIGRI